MMKTYIASLLCILMAGAQFVQAQESMDDVFANLDSDTPEVAVESAPAGDVDAAPAPVGNVAATAATSEELFERGVALYQAEDYDQAEAVFEAMLSVDSYNKDAMAYLERTAKRIAALEKRKQESTRAASIAVIDAAWNQDPKVTVKIEPPKTDVVDPEAIAAAKMTERIKGIMIPSLDFRDANVKDVVLFLSETCRRLDEDEGKGINMLLLGVDGSFDMEGNSVTISIRDMSLFDALKYISEMAKLKFDVRGNAVAIMPIKYAPEAEMEIRTYKVSPEVGSDLESAGGSGGDSGGDSLFGDDSFSSESAAGPTDVAGYFSMVEFPDGATAVYHSTFGKLIVNNTPDNFKALETILSDMEDEAIRRRSQQVEIEAKFVEFNEGALEELGFDWSVYGTGSVGGFTMKDGDYFQKTSGYLAPRDPYDPNGNINGGQYIPETVPTPIYENGITGYQQIEGNGQNIFGGAQRTSANVFDVVQSGVLASMGGSPAAMVFGNGDVDVRIAAMEQEGTADVLSAPKVTTKSGNEAIIRVVEVHRYPQDYDVETGQRTAPVVKPQDWEDFDLGVSLKVTPVVDADSNTIDLDMQPEITKFRGFDSYIVGYNAYDVGGNETQANGGDGSALVARMPYFEKRFIQTQVTIADGNTVLMGGLVDERTETFRDQVPFLGDIPYLGRLFRTEGSRSAKKNLVIYVRATQVDDHGMSQKERDTARLTMAN